MGVNTLITLPEDVQLSDVTEVCGILAGLKPERVNLRGNDGNCWFVRVDGARAKTTTIPEMVDIIIEAPGDGLLIDGEKWHRTTYHFEPDSGSGRLVYPRATAFWIAVGLGLIKFFGGTLSYSDCDEGINKRCKKPRKNNHPTDGKLWQDFQQAMMDIKPLTKADLDKARKFAAYK